MLATNLKHFHSRRRIVALQTRFQQRNNQRVVNLDLIGLSAEASVESECVVAAIPRAVAVA